MVRLMTAALIVAAWIAMLPGPVLAQQTQLKEQIVGTWSLVSLDNTAPDGTKRNLFGASPKGLIIIDANGRFSQVQVRSDRPKFAVNNRLQGTAEENKAAIAGSYAAFGKWSVEEGSKTFTRHIEGNASFPNEDGRDSKWLVTALGDEMTAHLPTPSAGGKTVIVWKRVK